MNTAVNPYSGGDIMEYYKHMTSNSPPLNPSDETWCLGYESDESDEEGSDDEDKSVYTKCSSCSKPTRCWSLGVPVICDKCTSKHPIIGKPTGFIRSDLLTPVFKCKDCNQANHQV